jgi:GMP synthase (glutamine-hydrolysing)
MPKIVSLPSILSVVCGQAPDPIASAHGDYMDWFEAGLGGRVNLVPWTVQEDLHQPPLEGFDGVLVTGSPASLTRPEPWMEVVVETIRQAAETDLPLLGVCFGHQLVGCAYGAPTTSAPGDGEVGTMPIDLNDAGLNDPLFKDIPPTFLAQLTHHDQVDPEAIAYSNGLRVLASSPNTSVQALAGGDFIRSVQFHPEFSAPIMASYIARDQGDNSSTEDCPLASKVLHNWLDGWIFKS